MRSATLDAGTTLAELEDLLLRREPLLLALKAPPADVGRLDLLQAIAARSGLLSVTFSGTLETPLVEVAALADFLTADTEAALDLRGALLGPVLRRVPLAGLRRLLLVHGNVVPAASVIPRSPVAPHRSPFAMGVAARLLRAPRASAAVGMARELAEFGFVMTSDERLEGVSAFRERRPPVFRW